MNREEIHPSHEMEYDDYGSDDHDNHCCKICGRGTCFMCQAGEGIDDDELTAACLGYSHWDSRKIEGADDITWTVKKSGTGWPSGKK